MVETIRFDSQGRRIWPVIKIGNERLASGGGTTGGSKIANGFVACNSHGTVPRVWVRYRALLCICCRMCIVQHCEITQAVVRPNYSIDSSDATPDGSEMDHPDGHSY